MLDLCRCSLRERQPLRKIFLNVPPIRHFKHEYAPPPPNQIFLGGDPLLDLPGLLRYRISGDMEERLKKLEAAGGPVVLRLVEHMVQRDAGKRKTVKVRPGPLVCWEGLQDPPRAVSHLVSFCSVGVSLKSMDGVVGCCARDEVGCFQC